MASCFYYGKTGGCFMWNAILHFFIFGAGTTAGVALMCILQIGKQEDEELEKMQRRNEE